MSISTIFPNGLSILRKQRPHSSILTLLCSSLVHSRERSLVTGNRPLHRDKSFRAEMRHVSRSRRYLSRREQLNAVGPRERERSLQMREGGKLRARRQIRWSVAALGAIAEYMTSARDSCGDRSTEQNAIAALVSKLQTLTGNPRDACFRFVHRFGICARQSYQPWTEPDQQRLLELIVLHPPAEVAQLMQRSTHSIRAMLHKLGSSTQTARNWFTKFSLASALHIRADEIQKWIDQNWLKARVVDTGKLKKVLIDPDDFAQFCQQYRHVVMGRRFNAERLTFLQNFVFSFQRAGSGSDDVCESPTVLADEATHETERS
jgi:hypothetical protein